LSQSLTGPIALGGRDLWTRTLLAFGLNAAVLGFLYAPSPILYDSDSYYHLAVAEQYRDHGHQGPLESIRGGLLGSNFGDKEVLFHVLLEPFVGVLEPSTGGRLALTILGATVLTLVAHLSLRYVGTWGLLIPLWLLIASTEFTWRLVRLRPELLALTLIILGLWAAGARRDRWLLLIAAVFALSYTAIHAFVGLFLIVSLVDGWIFRRWRWRLVVYPLAGALIGLAIHPQFPDNLLVWWYQSVEYFRFKGVLDVGTEIRPNFTDVVLMVNLGWFLGLAILWRSTENGGDAPSDDLWLTFGVGAAVFGGLYLLMSRFSFYFVPLATLWVIFAARHSGRKFGFWVRLPWRGRVRSAFAWALCVVVSLPVATAELRRYRERTSAGPEGVRVTDREAFGRAVPAGGHVLAPWRSTPLYMFYAPQGRYLNVLDPVFLAATEPQADRLQREIFSGAEPDVPLAALVELDSPWIAVPAATGDATLQARLLADPRVEVLHRGSHWLFGIDPLGAEAFVREWKVVPPGSRLPPDPAIDIGSWEELPRSNDGAGVSVAGYVDATRISRQAECVAFAHRLRVEEGASDHITYELSASGPVALWLDEEQRVQMRRGNGAVLGRGVEISLDVSVGEHLLTVLSCADPDSGRNGFYLVERHRSQS